MVPQPGYRFAIRHPGRLLLTAGFPAIAAGAVSLPRRARCHSRWRDGWLVDFVRSARRVQLLWSPLGRRGPFLHFLVYDYTILLCRNTCLGDRAERADRRRRTPRPSQEGPNALAELARAPRAGAYAPPSRRIAPFRKKEIGRASCRERVWDEVVTE